MNSFEIKEIPGKGRAMVATKPFAVGETIFEEEPFVSRQFSWNAAYGYAACDHCMRPLETVLENVRRLANNNALIVPLAEYDPTTLGSNSLLNANAVKCATVLRIAVWNH
ncbi:unnamed protein product [Ceratitis capitata]|uniref:(Mediterranean fruit fly) hypothetical protein n=1 Tax=Ceratitis capitata TaxID=7213 RepID=A0A811TXY1_CERCA|nr:unnamed protein product [Ceratitis capitata]